MQRPDAMQKSPEQRPHERLSSGRVRKTVQSDGGSQLPGSYGQYSVQTILVGVLRPVHGSDAVSACDNRGICQSDEKSMLNNTRYGEESVR